MQDFFTNAQKAAGKLPFVSDGTINEVLLAIAEAAENRSNEILTENSKDLELMDIKDPKYDRLKLTEKRIADIASDIRNVASLPSPLGKIISETIRPNGMVLKKVSVAFGVIGIIYESRPNVSFDVFSLCLKSGNTCILKGSKDAHQSNLFIVSIIHDVLKKFGLDTSICTLLPAEREATTELLNAIGFVDLIIPRGSAGLIQYVRENAKIPVIETGAGICHTYFDLDGDLSKGINIVNNAKTRRVSVCNALDCLVIHEKRLPDLAELCSKLSVSNVRIYADPKAYTFLSGKYPTDLLEKATPESFGTEFLDYKMAVKTVSDLDEALTHIAQNSSKHSECIVSENENTCSIFEQSVDAACVYTNVSTAFTDGSQFGLGAEIGISTQKLHARGPMALEELTTYKWLIEGNGQIRDAIPPEAGWHPSVDSTERDAIPPKEGWHPLTGAKTASKTGPLVEIITIGDEILIGQIVDTNSAWMAKELNKEGFRVKQVSSVSDDENHIIEATDLAFKRADIILMTGGLGPTKDDITKQTLCKYFKTELVLSQSVTDNINELLSHRKSALNELTYAQAYVPKFATIIQNKRGTAPVTWFEKDGKILVSMPGVPYEMEWILMNEVLPRLKSHFKTPFLQHKTVLVYGDAESSLSLKLSEWENSLPDFIKLAYLPSPGLVKLRLTGSLEDKNKLEEVIEKELVKLRVLLGEGILAEEDISVETLIGRLMKTRKLKLATAESCTGGNIAQLITSVPGSSEYFMGSIVAYSNEVKKKMLGVSDETLENFGAVSQEVVEQMAKGVLEKLNADIAVSVSGIAGPDGGSVEKPVGTVWICVCTKDQSLSRRFQFGKIRNRNVNMASLAAMAMIKEVIEKLNS